MPSRLLITAGPSYEPIDDVRRITNLSTGELGVLLAETMRDAGHEVLCLMGEAATWRPPDGGIETRRFGTNADLATQLDALAEGPAFAAVLHCAALCDFLPAPAKDGGRRKISSHGKGFTLRMEPAPKLIADLRRRFPKAVIVGWKYELDGTRDELLERAQQQMDANRTDACVVNGTAYGEGLGLLPYFGELTHFPDKPSLCLGLRDWLAAKL